jgi:hypothetical protein
MTVLLDIGAIVAVGVGDGVGVALGDGAVVGDDEGVGVGLGDGSGALHLFTSSSYDLEALACFAMNCSRSVTALL